MTLASVLIAAGRVGERLQVTDVCEQLKMSPQELREDVSVLNVVNFGGGAYVIYAEILPSGEIEVDPEPYSDTFDRPARLLPIEANALVAAIDLIGRAHADLRSAREKVVEALGFDPADEGLQIVSPKAEDSITHTVELAVHESRLLEIEYWTQTDDRYSDRVVEPYALFNGKRGAGTSPPGTSTSASCATSGWTGSSAPSALVERFERREGLNPIADIGGWPRTGTVGGSRVARVMISAEQARWAREQRTVLAELPDGRDHRRDHLQGHRVPRPRGAQGGRRRGRARARRRPRGRARRRRGPDRPSDMSRRAAIAMSDEEVLAFLEEERVLTCATVGTRRLAAPDAALVRDPRRRVLGVDVREVPEDPQPRARIALHAAGRGRRLVPRAARRDAQVRRGDPPRSRGRRRGRHRRSPRRYGGGDGHVTPEQAAKRVALQFVVARRVASWDHRKLG